MLVAEGMAAGAAHGHATETPATGGPLAACFDAIDAVPPTTALAFALGVLAVVVVLDVLVRGRERGRR